MNHLADAIVYAVTYINLKENVEDDDDADVAALESICDYLSEATEEEKRALAEAAQRALDAENASGAPREEFAEAYASWMDDMFGEVD